MPKRALGVLCESPSALTVLLPRSVFCQRLQVLQFQFPQCLLEPAFKNEALGKWGTLKNASLNDQYFSTFLGKLGTRALAFPEHRSSFHSHNISVGV